MVPIRTMVTLMDTVIRMPLTHTAILAMLQRLPPIHPLLVQSYQGASYGYPYAAAPPSTGAPIVPVVPGKALPLWLQGELGLHLQASHPTPT